MKLFYCAAWIAVMSIVLSCNQSTNETQLKTQVNRIADGELLKAPPQATEKGIMNEFFTPEGNQAADSTAQQTPGTDNPKKQPATPQQNIDWDKKIIKNASINAEVKDFKAFYATFREKVKSVGGYIAQEEQNQSEYKIENSVVVKVPVDQFDEAVAQITASTERINEKKITSSDVTTEVVDTKSRMETKRQVRSRYLDLLKQAKNMEEILHVQNDINGIQEEIESAAGRIEYLNHASVFSTITMTFYQVLDVSAKDKGKPGFGTELANAFSGGSSWIRDLFIGIVSIWPLLLMVAFVIVMFKKAKGRKVKTDVKQQNSEVLS